VVNAFAERDQFLGGTHGEVDEGHGRKETRIVSVLELEEWPWTTKKNGDWAGLRTAVRIERTREALDGTTTTETHYFVSSLPPDPKRIANAIRAHWGIEDSLHWVLDVAFADDRRKVRDARAAENLAIVARIALTLVKREPTRARGRHEPQTGWVGHGLPRPCPHLRKVDRLRCARPGVAGEGSGNWDRLRTSISARRLGGARTGVSGT
jgi:predicted transposase YbfD/YdcC